MSKVYDCLLDLKEKLQSIAGLETRVFICYDPSDLERQVLGVNGQSVGVVYQGLRSVPEPGSNKHGQSTIGAFALFVKYDTPQFANTNNNKDKSLDLLESMRAVIMRTSAPTGHKWRFVTEVIGSANKEKVVWMQTWDTPVQI